MRIVNLFSGSKGNCTFIGYGTSKILIDAGSTAKKIEESLLEIGENMSEIRAVLVTHEHDDHIHALKRLVKKYDFDVFVHEKVALTGEFCDLEIDKNRIKTFSNGEFEVGEFQVLPFETSHDSLCAVGFCVSVLHSRAKVGFVTDTGTFDENMVKALSGAKIVFIESNYDENMLFDGNYPPVIKRRIASDHGHLSNYQSLELAKQLYLSGTKCFVLSHISENNKTYEIAYSNFADYFSGSEGPQDKDVKLRVAFQRKHGNNFILKEDFDGK